MCQLFQGGRVCVNLKRSRSKGQRVFGGPQRHAGKPAPDRCRALAADDRGLAAFFQFGALEIFRDDPMRCRLAREDEVAARLLHGGGDGLTGEQVVAKENWPELGHRRTMAGEPALDRVAFAILLLRSVRFAARPWGTINLALGLDPRVRRQRQHLFVARCHDAGAKEAVEIFRAAAGTLSRRTARASDLARAKMLGSIDGNRRSSGQWAIWTPERVEHALGRDCFEEQWM